MKIKDCSAGQPFTGYLAVKECLVRKASNNTIYLALTVTDGETEVMGRVWEHSGIPPAVNTVIYVSATIGEYKGQAQITINNWRQAGLKEYNPRDFLPVCPIDMNQLKSQLSVHIENVKDPGYYQLLFSIFQDEDFVKAFFEAPAAVFHHHVYLGGLLHHTVGVIDQCLRLATPDSDIDLLLTGAILHDCGKTRDYDWYSGCAITQTLNGKLLGHIVQGIMLVNDHVRNCSDLSPGRLSLLLHMITSHHGQLQWGSPVEPACLEAVLLHNADMLDVQIFKLNLARSQMREGEVWTDKIPGINRQFYIG